MFAQLNAIHLIFYFFAAVAVGSAFNVITVRNPVYSVLSLVVTFFAMSGVWMLLQAEFLSLILLLVYVGAVMTLFLFVVMMLNIDTESKKSGFVRYLPFGLIIVLLLIVIILITVGPNYFGLKEMPAPIPTATNYNNLSGLGKILYTTYLYPFEIAGVILLAAIIAAITLTFRGPVHRKVQNLDKQLAVRPEDRLHLIKMPSDSKQKGL